MNTPTLDSPPTLTRSVAPQTAELALDTLQLASILVPLDLSEMSLKSMRYALALARHFGADVTLLHVVELPPHAVELPSQEAAEHATIVEAQKRLEAIRASVETPGLTVTAMVRHGFIFEQIISAARDVSADLIITTTHGYTGLKHLLMGSTAECIVRNAPCPVLVVREPNEDLG